MSPVLLFGFCVFFFFFCRAKLRYREIVNGRLKTVGTSLDYKGTCIWTVNSPGREPLPFNIWGLIL